MPEKTGFSGRIFARYIFASTASMLVFSLYSIVDGIVVSHGVGETALAAVNLSMPFSNIIFAIAVLLSVGASTAVSIHMGRGEMEKARAVFTQNTLVVAALAVLISVLVELFIEPIAVFLGAEGELLPLVCDYLSILCRFAMCYMVSYSLEVMVKADGFPMLSIVGVLSCCIMNIGLDCLFVFGFNWGIKGAALATGIAQLTSMCIFIIHFLGKRARLKPLMVKPFLSAYKRIIPLGFSDFFAEISLALTAFLYNRTILAYIGQGGVVSFAVVNYINTLVLMLFAGVTQGMQPLVSRAYGAGDIQACRGYYRLGLWSSAAAGIIGFGICNLFAPFITSLLLERSSVMFDYTVWALRAFSISFLIAGTNICSTGYMTAMERPRHAMTAALLRGIVFVAAAILLLPHIFGGNAVWFASAVSECLCIGVTLLLVTGVRRKTENIL